MSILRHAAYLYSNNRAAKEIAYLTQARISFEGFDIIKNPPSRELLGKDIDEHNLEALINTHSKRRRDLNPVKRRVSKAELIDLMLKDPNLIKLPVIIGGKNIYFRYSEI